MQKGTNRRSFLKAASALSAGYFVAGPRDVLAGPNDKIRVACIGVRGQGGSLLANFANQTDVDVTHIVDIDESVRTRKAAEIKAKTGKEPKLVINYQDILNEKSIDAFVIGTPDHWHALPCIHGCMAGKDVYVEKPDGHNIAEGKTMVAAARKYNRMVQMGTQARSAAFLKEAVEYIRAGNIGKPIFGRSWETDRQARSMRCRTAMSPTGWTMTFGLGPHPNDRSTSAGFMARGDGSLIMAVVTWAMMAYTAWTTADMRWVLRASPNPSAQRVENISSTMHRNGPTPCR